MQIGKLLDDAGFDARLAAENCHPDDRAHILKMPEALTTITPDAIVLFQFSTYDPAFPAVAALPNPKIVFFQNITPERFFRGHDDHTADLVRQGLDQRPLCAQFDVIMANSIATAAALCEGLPAESAAAIDQTRIVACPPVIGTDRWDDIVPGETLDSDKRRLILFVGRLVPHKGVDDLIDGFALLANDNLDVRLAIVGGPANSPLALALKQRVAALDTRIASRIAFHHDISEAELKALYHEAHVCASMSQHEGFGVPLLDAMFFDKPLVIRSEPGMEETAGDAALVIGTPEAANIAGALAFALNDAGVQARLAQARAIRLDRFRRSADGTIIINALAKALRQAKMR
ncbi:MAG: glycosyl transferase family 1 [Bradyrhizobiaceae bacterium PARB1]|nr:MAG: glycosyl transferase family 1 [Bradyrhizobiaceae bacterium PARB1]